MSESFRRFEILLPRQFNDGRLVPDELIADTLIELEVRFGAVSCETQIIRGQWLKTRFKQLDIWMTTYPIEVL